MDATRLRIFALICIRFPGAVSTDDTGDTIGEAGAVMVDDVAMGDASTLVASILVIVVLGALKAANEPTAAKVKKAAISHTLPSSPSFPRITFGSATTDPERLEKGVAPIPMVCGAGRNAPPGREDEYDHWVARDLVLAEACRPAQRVVKAQAAIFNVREMYYSSFCFLRGLKVTSKKKDKRLRHKTKTRVLALLGLFA